MNTAQHLQLTDVLNADDLHCAFLIDEQGNEIMITREMIDQACDGLAYSVKTQTLE
mgnify:CR=1 FL=1